jgi:glycosyltransferase involved in cell wall biosynthesis
MADNHPLVSVIIPVFNGEAFLAQAVDSARRQTYRPLEIIVVDDGSTDGTAEVAAQLGPDLRYVRQPNGGLSAARNHGLQLARGDLIAMLDVDDLWPEDKLEVQVGRLLAEPRLQVVLGLVRYVRLPGARHPKFPLEDQVDGVPCDNVGAMLYRREAFEIVGPFDESLRIGEDRDWFLRAVENDLPLVGVNHITLYYRLHATNMTLGPSAMAHSLTRSFKRRLDRSRQQGASLRPLRPLAEYYDPLP